MNLSLYTVTGFLIIDTDGHRVLAKYYHPKGHPNGESKKLTTLKEQRAFEKGRERDVCMAMDELRVGHSDSSDDD